MNSKLSDFLKHELNNYHNMVNEILVALKAGQKAGVMI